MEIRRTPPRRRRRGPSCLLVIIVLVVAAAGVYIIANADTVRETIILPPTPEPTRSAASYAASAALLEKDGEFSEAIDSYEQSIRLDSSRIEFYLPLIELLISTNQSEEALDWAEYLKEEQARADFEFVLSPNGNKVSKK